MLVPRAAAHALEGVAARISAPFLWEDVSSGTALTSRLIEQATDCSSVEAWV